MEYKIDNEIKYTTLHIRSMLFLKMDEQKEKKRYRRKSPMGGWGMGLKEPIQKLFLLPAVTISEN